MSALMVYHAIAPCTSKGGISASAILVVFGGHFSMFVYR